MGRLESAPSRLVVFAVVIGILAVLPSVLSGPVTGYDFEVTYGSFEEARRAIEYFESSPTVYHVTDVSGTTVSVYTTSKEALDKLSVRRDALTVKEVEANYDGYFTYETMTAKLVEWNNTYSQLCRVFSIGRSVEGRELWAVEISTTPGDQTAFKPNVKYIGNMHGDEVVGRELLMRFIDRLLNDPSPAVRSFVQNTNTFIVPTMNPDGFARGTRSNARGYDLNRNFPDQYRGQSPEQQETRLMRDFIHSRQWSVSANYHGGDLVANYPWDGRPDNRFQGENKSPDDDTFRYIAKTYASRNEGMYRNPGFPEGITNGAAWYVLFGGMQDFNYIHAGCLELTLEVSMVKWPPGSQLGTFWDQNKDSMLAYLSLINSAHSIRGIVIDGQTTLPIPGAQITVNGREISKVISRRENGAYFRLLPPGASIDLTVKAEGYLPHTFRVQTPPLGAVTPPIRRDVVLTRAPATTQNPSPAPHIITVPVTPQTTAVQEQEQVKTEKVDFISTSNVWPTLAYGLLGMFAAIAVGTLAMLAYLVNNGLRLF